MPSTLVDILTSLKESKDGYVAFVESSNQVNYLFYPELYSKAQLCLGALQNHGIRPGDEVILQVENNLDFVITFWACVMGGIIPVPLSVGQTDDHKYKITEVSTRLNRPYLVISDKAFNALNKFFGDDSTSFSVLRNNAVLIDQIKENKQPGELHDVQEHDVAFIQFSSGSTSRPKGVMLTHANLICNMSDIANGGQYAGNEKLLSWMPLTHDMGLIGFHLNPMMCGMSHWIINTNLFIRRPGIWMELASEHRIEVLCSPNFGYHYLLRHFPQDTPQWDLSAVRIIYNGAEPISKKICDDFTEKLAPFGLSKTAICPVYGLAEASLAVAMTPLDQTARAISLEKTPGVGEKALLTTEDKAATQFVNVGKVIRNTSILIVDDQREEVAEGIAGHVLIKGDNVTSGYYNDPDATAASLQNNWLRTGDLGFLSQGDLYITGRSKDIVFINGLNYYPHDLERMAQELDEIELNKIIICSCQGRDESRTEGQDEINAFVFFRGKPERFIALATRLKQHLFEKTGVLLDKILPTKDIPRTTSGKLQRFKIQKAYEDGEFHEIASNLEAITEQAHGGSRASWTVKQQGIVDLIEQVCEIKVTSLDIAFFELGLTSLKAQQFLARLSDEKGVQIAPSDLYQLRSLRALMDALGTGKLRQYQPIELTNASGPFFLSAAQERIFYAWELNKSSCAYNIPFAIKLEGKVDVDRLRQAIREVLQNVPTLHYQFKMEDVPTIHLVEQPRYQFEVIQRQQDVSAQLAESVQPFDLENGPLARIHFLQDDTDTQVLFLDFHHIIFDGISMSLFLDQVTKAYRGEVYHAVVPSYQDYIQWQQEIIIQDQVKGSKEFWSEQLGGELSSLDLPTDFSRKASASYQGGRVSFQLEKDLAERLKQSAWDQGCTPHVWLLAAYGLLLQKYTNQEALTIGIPVSGRVHPDLHQSFGMFVNNLPMVLHPRDQTWKQWVNAVQTAVDQAFVYQDYPFNAMVNDLGGKAKLNSGSLLFDTMFNYQNMSLPDSLDEQCQLSRLDFDPGFSKYDLSLEIFEEASTFNGAFEYASDLFSEATIDTLSEQFQFLLKEILQHPEKRLEAYSLQSEQLQEDTIHDFNNTHQDFARKSVIELFLEQAENQPEAIALRLGEEKWTYAELARASATISDRLKNDNSILPGDRVIVYGDRAISTIASMLAALRSGVVYVPIDVNEAPKKIEDICADCKPKALLTTDEWVTGFPESVKSLIPEIIKVDQLSEVASLPIVEAKKAYMIYTSGSTAKPKGVVVGNEAFSNYAQWATQYYDLSGQTFACFTSLSFDLTITSIFTPLVAGGTIALFNEQDQVSQLERIFEDALIGVIKLTPSHLKLLLNHPTIQLPNQARTLIVGGEAFEAELALATDRLFKANVRIFNEYGPTEATVGCMCYEFDPSVPEMLLGRPVANASIYLLDEQLQPVADNLIGEIYVGGVGLADEYFGNAAMTAEKFIEHPSRPDERLYRTGDLARRTQMGMTYLGRSDNQMKINGHRVEAGEIESKIRGIQGVKDAAVVLKEDKLIGYLVGDEHVEFDKSLIIRELSAVLPPPFVPRTYFQLQQVPLAQSGKTDYKALEHAAGVEVMYSEVDQEATSGLEEVMLGFWRQVLKEEQIRITDNFFELGGDSIKAVQLSSLLFGEGIQVQAQEILTHQTIFDLIQNTEITAIDQMQANREIAGKKERTFIDRWFFSQQFSQPEQYHQFVTLDLKKEVVPEVLEQCFRLMIKSHDVLRLQVSGDELTILSHEDAPDFELDVAQIEEEADFENISKLLNHSINFSSGLLLRAALIQSEKSSQLFITCHHLLVDGVSWRILLSDLANLMDQAENGEQIKLPAKTNSVIDWSKAINELQYGEESISYWQEANEKRKQFLIEPDVSHELLLYREAASESFILDQEWTEALLLAQKESWIDPINTLSTALVFALRDFTGSESFIVDYENHGRHLDDLNVSRTVGWFTAMYPVQLQLLSEDINEAVKSTKEQLDGVPDQGLSYSFNEGSRPFSEIRFNFLGDFDQSFESDWFAYQAEASGAWVGPDNRMTAKLDLNAWIVGGQLQLEISYHQPSFLQESITGLGQNFMTYLKSILSELKGEVHFTSSDFDAIEMDDDLMESLF